VRTKLLPATDIRGRGEEKRIAGRELLVRLCSIASQGGVEALTLPKYAFCQNINALQFAAQ